MDIDFTKWAIAIAAVSQSILIYEHTIISNWFRHTHTQKHILELSLLSDSKLFA